MSDYLGRFSQFDSFISYYETNAKPFAEIVRKILSAYDLKAFVAHVERKTYSENFDDVRDIVIKSSKYFIFINTENALTRNQIFKEFMMAYPNGITEKPKLIILRHHASNV